MPATGPQPEQYPASIMDGLQELEALLQDSHSIARRIRENPGVRSKLFAQSPTGQSLIGEDSSLERSLGVLRQLASDLGSQADAMLADRVACLLAAPLAEGRPFACILAPMFTDDNVTDGYFRRVKNVDDLIPERYFRLYLHYERMIRHASVQVFDDSRICINYGPESNLSDVFDLAARHTRIVYAHSIHRFDKRFFNSCPETTPFVLDFHGVVPEELAYSGEAGDVVALFEENERLAVSRANAIVCVSESMIDHIKQKHPQESKDTRFMIMPILDVKPRPELNADNKRTDGGKPTAIYAGGTQKWQMIDEMFDAIERQGDLCSYRIFIPNPAQFDAIWKDRAKPADLLVSTRTPDQLVDEYRACQFGFILREDCVVNRVACPTKLTEYLANDVIPIVSTPEIGDFARKGMRYVSVDDFIGGKLPDGAAQADMLKANRHVLDSIESDFEHGRSEVGALFALN